MLFRSARANALAAQRGKRADAASAPSRLPAPFARWSFDSNARDQSGVLHAELLGGATLRDGRLVLDGRDGYARTAPLGRELREKTLEAWVALADFDQRGGGVIAVETEDGVTFDAIVFAEKDPRRWMAGSNFFKRTRTVDGAAETAKPGELVHIAIAYRGDGSISIFRNGRAYGAAYTPDRKSTRLNSSHSQQSRMPSSA